MSLLESASLRAFLARARDAASDGKFAARDSAFEELAGRWRRLGLAPGELVLVALPNSVDLLDHFFAVLAADGVPALVSPATPAVRLRELARSLGARACLALRPNNTVLNSSPPQQFGNATVSFWPGERQPPTRPGEVVLLTSGTSGLSSACAFDLDQLRLNGARHVQSIGQRPGDTVLVSLPFYFSFALVAQALGTWGCGGNLIVGNQPFHVKSYRDAVAKGQVTVSSLTPIQVRQLLQHEDAWPSSLRVLTVGGDSLPRAQVELLLRRRPGQELYLTYGLTQAGPRVSTLAAHAEPAERYTSVGRPLAGVEVSLRDVGHGRCELLVRSATTMKRRLGQVEGRGPDWATPGLLATGDAFDLDLEGYLYHRGRLADFVIINGEKVCLASVRRLACEYPGVISARSRTLSHTGDPDGFELLLTTEGPGSPALADNVARYLRPLLRSAERPRQVHLIDSVPDGAYK